MKQGPKSPAARLTRALACLTDPILRLRARRIYNAEAKECSIFWDEVEREVEFVGDDWEIVISQRNRERVSNE